MMKRSRDGEADDISAMANCLMLLSAAAAGGGAAGGGGDSSRLFTCKTCNRQFSSFQALGGHRASHKKPRLAAGEPHPPSPVKPKAHECSICGQEFPLGQALGGHMRRHRAAMSGQNHQSPPPSPPLSLFPVVKKPNSRRILCPDLNLTPLENHGVVAIDGKGEKEIDALRKRRSRGGGVVRIGSPNRAPFSFDFISGECRLEPRLQQRAHEEERRDEDGDDYGHGGAKSGVHVGVVGLRRGSRLGPRRREEEEDDGEERN